MRQTAFKTNRTGWMLSAVTIVYCMLLGTTGPSQAQDKVVVIPMGNHGAPVAKTGQTTSYKAGDDGDLQKGANVADRFKDNGNGTVTDGLTRLIWLKAGNCSTFFSGDITGANLRTWADAITAANKLASPYCGLSDGSKAGDWRLPNLKELESLIDLGHANPPLPPGCPLTASTVVSYYWSSTTVVGYSNNYAWYLTFDLGTVSSSTKLAGCYVRAVRGGQ